MIADCYHAAVSTPRTDKRVKTLLVLARSESQVSRMAAELVEYVAHCRHRSLAEAGPSTFVAADTLAKKVRDGGRV